MDTKNSHTAGYYRLEIDGLRAIAVLSVLLNHIDRNLLPSGHLGVDIFFVISGYVITASLRNSKSNNLSYILLDFYTRRIKRLLPALILCVTLTSFAICLFDPTPEISLKTAIASLFGLSNIFLFQRAIDYFAPDATLNVFTHTWSLGVEEQFYSIYPLLFGIFMLHFSHSQRRFGLLMIFLVTASLILFVYLNTTNPPAAFFLMPSRFWELGAGCLLQLFSDAGRPSSNTQKHFTRPFLPLLIAALFVPPEFTTVGTLAVVALTLLVIATITPSTLSYRFLTHPPIQYLGLISYSFYLWHWSVLSVSQWTIGVQWWTIPFQILLISVLAIVSFKYVEQPLRRSDWSFFRLVSVSYGVSASAAAAGILLLLLNPLYGALFVGAKDIDKAVAASALLPLHPDDVHGARDRVQKCNMTPHLLQGHPEYRPKPVVDAAFVRQCISTSSSANKFLLVGDSFAQVTAPHLSIIARNAGYDFRVISGYGCPFPLPFERIKSRTSDRCSEVDEKLLENEIVGALREGDLLIVRLYLPKSQYLSYSETNLPPIDAYDNALRVLFDRANAAGAKVLLIGANPTLTPSQVRYLNKQWFNSSAHAAGVENSPLDNRETAYYHAIEDHLPKIVESKSGTSYFSLRPYLCELQLKCKMMVDAKVLYTDKEHVSSFAHDLFFEDLSKHITDFLAHSHQQ